MASLEEVRYTPYRVRISEGVVTLIRVKGRRIDGVPQIYWRSGHPWREANMWAIQRAGSKHVKLKTVLSNFVGLHAYAQWLELNKTYWWDVPVRRAEQCLIRYRGALIDSIETGELRPSTASQRMRSVIQFYRWVYANLLLSTDWPMWQDRIIGIRIGNSVGLQRTLAVKTTSLSIPNRKARGERLEDGLVPVSSVVRAAILNLARETASKEIFLMLTLGFYTGMRIETITNMKIETLMNAVPDPRVPGIFRISIGPGAIPPVATKFGVNGTVSILKPHLDELIAYTDSVHRKLREAKADNQDKDLVFLTRFGNSYTQRRTGKSGAINVEMHYLRKRALANGIGAIRNFRFHQTRCTFATELALLAMQTVGPINAVAIVKDALLHLKEAYALQYIRFVEKTPGMIAAANDFTREFLGLVRAGEQDHDSKSIA
jgi:integrase